MPKEGWIVNIVYLSWPEGWIYIYIWTLSISQRYSLYSTDLFPLYKHSLLCILSLYSLQKICCWPFNGKKLSLRKIWMVFMFGNKQYRITPNGTFIEIENFSNSAVQLNELILIAECVSLVFYFISFIIFFFGKLN